MAEIDLKFMKLSRDGVKAMHNDINVKGKSRTAKKPALKKTGAKKK